MASRGISARTVAACLACIAITASTVAVAESGSDAKQKPETGPQPAFRVEVEPLGYVAPSRFYLIARLASTTLDFIDNHHLLFTFREGGLLHRLPDGRKDDDDQMIRAVVLDIPSGKVVQQTRWRMHDRQRYLWAIGGGQFLVRQRNALYLTDSRLELRPYLSFDTVLEALTVAPDHNMMMVEFDKYEPPSEAANDNGASTTPPMPTLGDQAPPPVRMKSIQVLMMRPHDNSIVAKSEVRHAVDIPLLHNGFVEVLEGNQPDRWLIRHQPFGGEASTLAVMKSACDPNVVSLSDSVVLAVGCPAGSNDHAVTAYSSTGTVLWQDRWQPRYIWPTFEFAENGSRFAYSSLQLNHAIGTLDPFGEDDVVAQMVGVFDTETGKLAMVKSATPVLSGGHNYSLSADGLRFAILREGEIEVYDLPPATTATAVVAKAAAK